MFWRNIALLDLPFFPVNLEQDTLAPFTVSENQIQLSAAYIQCDIYSGSFLSHSSLTFPNCTVAKAGSQDGSSFVSTTHCILAMECWHTTNLPKS